MSDALISCRPASLQWMHSVASQFDFVTTWQAADDAVDLSRELGFAPTVPSIPALRPTPRPMITKWVSFSKTVDLRLCTEKVTSDHVVPCGLFQSWPLKPWTLNGSSVDAAHDDADDLWLMQTGSWTLPSSSPIGTNASGLTSPTQDGLADSWSEDVCEKLALMRSPSISKRITSHGLSETGVGSRSFEIRNPSPESLTEQIREVWPEFKYCALRIHVVTPQPQDLTVCLHLVVEFVLVGDEPHCNLVATLEETVIWDSFGQPDVCRVATYFQQRLHHLDIMKSFHVICRRAKYICNIRVLGRLLPLDHMRVIVPGTFVQVHAFPPQFHESASLADYFAGMGPFYEDSMAILSEVHTPSMAWRFHLLTPDGYLGVAETPVPLTHAASPSSVADLAFSQWTLELPGALTYAGLVRPESVVQNFTAYDPEAPGTPCLVQISVDDHLGLPTPPPVASALPSVCTVQDIIAAINAQWLNDVIGVSISVFDGFLTFDVGDRFRPKLGSSYTIYVEASGHDEVSTLQLVKRNQLVCYGLPVVESPPLHAVVRRPCDDTVSCPICPSSTRLLDEWIEQTTIQPRTTDVPLEHTQDDVEPLLIIDEWEQLIHILSQFVESRADDLHLSMHGLLWNDVGVRYATAYPDIASIRASVIHAWEDFLRAGLVGYMHLTRPQERLQWNELQLIVEMRPAEVEPPGGGIPILRRISWHYLNDAPQQLAVYQTSGMALYAFLAQAGLTNVCLTPGSRECNLYVEQSLQSPLAPVRLHPGSLVEIFLHGVEEGGEADESGLMQQPRPSRSPDLVPTRLLGLNHINSLFHANPDEALVVQLRRNWPLSTSRPDDLEAVHFVAFPPVPTEQVYLVHFRHDRFSQAHVDDVLILVTMSFTAPDGSRIQKARVLWGPKRATRSQFLDFLRLGWFCDQSTVLCWTYLNNQPWMEQASLTRRLEFGDHLRVQIRSDSIQWSDIEYAEEVSCSRRIFVDSPIQSVSNPHGAVEDEDDHSEPNSRSRSRSRGHEEPSDEEAYFDEDGESEVESHSLIQLAAHRHRSRQTLSDKQPSTSDQNPHVFDRWCGGGSCGGEDCSDITPIAVLLAEPVPQSPSWKRRLFDASPSSSEVTALRDFLADVQPWPETAFSREWRPTSSSP